ncbi:hypothetical protein OROHE_017928 [Orobanche hederae]
MASKEHQVAVPETGKPDGDVQYFDSELDSDDDVQQTGDGAPNPPSQEGPSVRRRIAFEEMLATRQEMLDPSDTQMNTMFDELVCLGELTAPSQGILAGVGGATGGLEQPVVRMYVDATPPAQSIIPYAVESSSHSPIQTMAVQEIPKVILNVRPIRRRFPARAIRSPFLHDDIRGGDTLDEYLKFEDGGIETVEEVFDVMHRGMRKDFQRYDHKLFDPTVEEVIPVEEMDGLCLFAEAVQPTWGENMKQWIDCDKVP